MKGCARLIGPVGMLLMFYSAVEGADAIQFEVVTNSTGSSYGSVSAAIGDFDMDGRIDAVVVVRSNLFIFKGQGDGMLVRQTSYNLQTFGSPTVAVGKFNGGVRPDLLVAMAGELQIWRGNGDGTFAPGYRLAVNAAPNDVVIGDFNNDRYQDALLIKTERAVIGSANAYNEVLTLVPGAPDSSFRAPIFHPLAYRPTGRAAVGDFNRDGFLDVALGYSNIPTATGTVALVSVLLGNGDGSFTDGALFYAGALDVSDVRTADFNGDGVLDLLTAHFDMGYVSCLFGKGDGTFQAPIHSRAGYHSSSLVIGDFNGDGQTDVISADNVSSEIWVLEGDGTGRFQRSDQPLESRYPYLIETADFDNDKRPDFLGLISGTFEDGVVKTYLNRTVPRLHISGSAGQVTVWWRAWVDFILESRSALSPEAPWMVFDGPILESSGMKQTTLPAAGGSQFFRLNRGACD